MGSSPAGLMQWIDKAVSRKVAKHAKAAKERKEFHFALPCAFVPLCGMSCFDSFTPSQLAADLQVVVDDGAGRGPIRTMSAPSGVL